MKKIYFLIAILIMVVMYACHKENAGTDPDLKNQSAAASTFSIRDAKNYLKTSANLRSNSIVQQSVDQEIASRTGVIIWKKAQIYKKGKNEVIEVPIVLNKRIIPLFNMPGDSLKETPDESVVDAAFTRLVIYRDANSKIINKKIVTYIPDKSTLNVSNSDVSNNWINNLQSTFSGYLVYENWDGSNEFVIRIRNGKQTIKYSVSIIAKTSGQTINSIQSPIKSQSESCQTEDFPYWEQNCNTDAEGNKVGCIDVIAFYYSILVCVYTDDPPAIPTANTPDPPQPTEQPSAPGGGINSDDTNDSGNVINTDCSSFTFKKTSTANWQEAGVTNIRLKWVWIGGGSGGQSRTVFLPSVVFGLPTQYQNSDGSVTVLTPGAAAVQAAKLTEYAKQLTYIEFRDSPYFPDDATVLQYFKTQLATAMATQRGTAGATGTGSSQIIFNAEDRSDFFPYSCN